MHFSDPTIHLDFTALSLSPPKEEKVVSDILFSWLLGTISNFASQSWISSPLTVNMLTNRNKPHKQLRYPQGVLPNFPFWKGGEGEHNCMRVMNWVYPRRLFPSCGRLFLYLSLISQKFIENRCFPRAKRKSSLWDHSYHINLSSPRKGDSHT